MKKNIKNIPILISFVLIVFSSCNQAKEKPLSIDMIYGDWVGGFNSKLGVSISPDSLFWTLRDKFRLTQSYHYRISEDSIFLFSEDGMIDKLLLMPREDIMVCCNYKTYIDSFRIDEVTALRKVINSQNLEESNSQINNLKKDIIIVPENQIGIFLIAFSQKDGNEVTFDKLGNRVFTFKNGSNILFSQGQEDIEKMAFNQFEVYQQSPNGELILFPIIAKCELKKGKEEQGFMAIMEGFNQEPRKQLNKLVGKDVSGNVLWFNIGSEAEIHNNRDSIMYNGKYRIPDYKGIWK
ncbi:MULTISPECIES: hypothetical protein [unclassified Lentimicrobium]|uniref:hypothetical protein n=1 Tax=unclassified Lentimicrobium TaxID=2677434 RepID=UPI00155266F8|nr:MULTISPECIES: hypothetical protein [unclassified Lentimicrobium]NPD46411.1 hypothetical protein [Lentimicrobium sp. S6]NPD83597.1 hypothetical protein [Lentimicrobium sp. L6]